MLLSTLHIYIREKYFKGILNSKIKCVFYFLPIHKSDVLKNDLKKKNFCAVSLHNLTATGLILKLSTHFNIALPLMEIAG